MRLNRSSFLSAIFLSVLLTSSVILARAQSQKAPIQITADLADAPRKLYHAEVDLPVTAGPLTLTTPQWIPGNHRPTGPADSITGVVFTANGQTHCLAPRRRGPLSSFTSPSPRESPRCTRISIASLRRASRKRWPCSNGRSFSSIRPTRRSATFPSSLR